MGCCSLLLLSSASVCIQTKPNQSNHLCLHRPTPAQRKHGAKVDVEMSEGLSSSTASMSANSGIADNNSSSSNSSSDATTSSNGLMGGMSTSISAKKARGGNSNTAAASLTSFATSIIRGASTTSSSSSTANTNNANNNNNTSSSSAQQISKRRLGSNEYSAVKASHLPSTRVDDTDEDIDDDDDDDDDADNNNEATKMMKHGKNSNNLNGDEADDEDSSPYSSSSAANAKWGGRSLVSRSAAAAARMSNSNNNNNGDINSKQQQQQQPQQHLMSSPAHSPAHSPSHAHSPSNSSSSSGSSNSHAADQDDNSHLNGEQNCAVYGLVTMVVVYVMCLQRWSSHSRLVEEYAKDDDLVNTALVSGLGAFWSPFRNYEWWVAAFGGLLLFWHFQGLLWAFDTAPSTVINPLIQVSSTWVLFGSAIPALLTGSTFITPFDLLCYIIIFVGGLLPSLNGDVRAMLTWQFWRQDFVRNTVMSEVSIGLYDLMLSYVLTASAS